MDRVMVTGANGQIGRRLVSALAGEHAIEAVVRSERARRMLARHAGDAPNVNVNVLDPGDAAALGTVASRCRAAVHLIGTIREGRSTRYADADVRTARAVTRAAAQSPMAHIVYLSILGADRRSPSRCLRSRAEAEDILLHAATPVTVIRVPMILGEGDRASRALAKQARARRVFLFRAASLEQPIYAGDVVDAIRNALRRPPDGNRVYELAGPESLSRRDLIARAAALLGRRPSVHSLPLALGLGLACLLERLRSRPPVTRDMLHVLDHDDAIDPSEAAAALGVSLTPLDEMLRRCVGERLAQETIR